MVCTVPVHLSRYDIHICIISVHDGQSCAIFQTAFKVKTNEKHVLKNVVQLYS